MAAETNDSLPRSNSGQTKFGLQPSQNHLARQEFGVRPSGNFLHHEGRALFTAVDNFQLQAAFIAWSRTFKRETRGRSSAVPVNNYVDKNQ
jgi:hypothetical protein